MTYGEVLAYYLRKLEISQSELARRIGTGRQTINSIITGNRRGPTYETARAISKAIGVSLDDMARMMDEGIENE